VYERSGKVRFADRILAHVYDAQQELIGFLVEVAGRVRWCEESGSRGCKVAIDAACIETINEHLNRFQAMIDSGQASFQVITLPEWRRHKAAILPRAAMISAALRSHSSCAITAKDSELNAEGALRERRAQRNQER
jgi:hypothetical protein